MFGSKKKISADVRRTRFTTLIARDVVIAGDLEFAEGLRMDGHVKGNVTGKADSQALLVVSEHGKITGNIEYLQLRMDCGATVDGKLTKRDATSSAAAGKPASAAASTGSARDGHLVPSPSA